MGTISTCRPNSDVNTNWTIKLLSGSTRYGEIDEVSQDGDTTYIYTTNSNYTQNCGVSTAGLSSSDDVNSLVVGGYFKRGTTASNLRIGFNISGTDYWGSVFDPGNAWSFYSTTLSIPAGVKITDIANGSVLVQSYGTYSRGQQANCTQLWAQIDWTTASSIYDITFKVKDWYYDAYMPGVSIIGLDSLNAVVDSAVTDSTGYAIFSGVSSASISKWVFRNNQWDFTPNRVDFDFNEDSSFSITLGPDTIWPNIASAYAFRYPIYFGELHSAFPSGYQIKYPFKTGNNVMFANNADFNFGQGAIHYFNFKTHILYRHNTGALWGVTYYHTSNSWGSPVFVATSRMSDITLPASGSLDPRRDTHYYPEMLIDKYGDIHIIQSTHATQPSDDYYMAYYKLSNNILDSNTIDTAYVAKGSYPLFIEDDDNNILYIFRRLQTGVGGSRPSKLAFDYKYLDSSIWYQNNVFLMHTAEADFNSSLYFGGVKRDNNGNIHFTAVTNDGYLGDNINGGVYHLYSPIDTALGDSTPMAGKRWYAVNGTYLGDTSDPPYSDPINLSNAVVDTAYNYRSDFHNDQLGTNLNCNWVHHYDTCDNGTHQIYKPFVISHEYQDGEPSGFNFKVLYWYEPSNVNSNSHGWVKRNLSTATINDKGGYTYLAGGTGALYIDRDNNMRVFGMYTDTSYTLVSSALQAWDVQEWYSNDYGLSWNWKKITQRTGIGFGGIWCKPNYSNNLIEFFYNRGSDLFYYNGNISDYGRTRLGGEDVQIFYTGGESVNTSVPVFTNYWDNTTSELIFPIATSIPEDKIYDTAGMHYIYCGKYTSTPYNSNIQNIFSFVDSFEGYDTGSAFINSELKYLYNSTTVSTGSWKVGNIDESHIASDEIYTGEQVLRMYKLAQVATSYLSTILPLNNNFIAEVYSRPENANDKSGAMFGYLDVNNTFWGFGALEYSLEDIYKPLNWSIFKTNHLHTEELYGDDVRYGYWDTALYTEYKGGWRKMQFIILDSVISFYGNDNLLYVSTVYNTPKRLVFGLGHQPLYSTTWSTWYNYKTTNPELFFDYINIRKAVSTAYNR